MIDIGRVFATSWAMLRQRFWLLVGMFAVFFAIQLVGSTVLGIVLAVMGAAGAMSIGAGLDDPAAITGMSVGFVIIMVIFYGAYLVLILAQQAAMVTLASPLEEASFGTAMVRGFKSALPFFAISVILMVGYFALSLLAVGVAGAVGFAGGAAGTIVGVILLVLLVPVIIYLGCRLAVLIPVVAVDQVFNPIAAIRRSWAVTEGRALGIFLATLTFGLLTLVIMGLPFAVIVGTVTWAKDSPGVAIGVAIIAMLGFIPMLLGYTAFASSYIAALHSEVTGGGSDALEEVFA